VPVFVLFAAPVSDVCVSSEADPMPNGIPDDQTEFPHSSSGGTVSGSAAGNTSAARIRGPGISAVEVQQELPCFSQLDVP